MPFKRGKRAEEQVRTCCCSRGDPGRGRWPPSSGSRCRFGKTSPGSEAGGVGEGAGLGGRRRGGWGGDAPPGPAWGGEEGGAPTCLWLGGVQEPHPRPRLGSGGATRLGGGAAACPRGPGTHLQPAEPDHAVHHLSDAEAVAEVVEGVVPVVVVHAELRRPAGPPCATAAAHAPAPSSPRPVPAPHPVLIPLYPLSRGRGPEPGWGGTLWLQAASQGPAGARLGRGWGLRVPSHPQTFNRLLAFGSENIRLKRRICC